jgi:hypothetical protein
MARVRARTVLLGTAATAALAVASAVPAQAAGSAGWHVARRLAVHGAYAQYTSVAAAGGHAWAAGGYGVAGYGSPSAAYWNGSRWSATSFPSAAVGEIQAVSADSPGDAWAVCAGDVLHWHDGRWTVARTWNLSQGPPGPYKSGISAFSPTDVWVFGGSSYGNGTWHLHGRTWTKVTGPGASIFTASAVSATDMWAIGGASADEILRYAGGGWHHVASPVLSGLEFGGIYASSASSVWVTATVSGTTGLQLLHLRGDTWTSYRIPWTLALSAVNPENFPFAPVGPDGRGGLWLSGYSSTTSGNWLLHVSESGAWSRVALHAGIVRSIAAIPGTTSLVAAGLTSLPSGDADGLVWAYGAAG